VWDRSVLAKWMAKMTKMFCRQQGDEGGGIPVATACSGSDNVFDVFGAFQRSPVLSPEGQPTGFRFRHIFGVELDPDKREFLFKKWEKLKTVFTDITFLGMEPSSVIPDLIRRLVRIASISCDPLGLDQPYLNNRFLKHV